MAESKAKQPSRRGGDRGQGFKKGQSGNPGGRPTEKVVTPDGEVVNLRELARSYTLESIGVIAECLKHKDKKIAMVAAQTMLDRGWGKAAQSITGEDGEGPIKQAVSIKVEFV